MHREIIVIQGWSLIKPKCFSLLIHIFYCFEIQVDTETVTVSWS